MRIKCRHNGGRISRVDHHGMPAIVNQPQVIVLKSRYSQYSQHTMDHPSPEKSIIALGPWLETPTGSYARAWQQARLDELTADIFGFNAVQIGLPQINALQANRMPNKWLTNTQMPVREQSDSRVPVVVVHD